VKLLIVGEGRVGKTCLSQALLDDNYELALEESTEGININTWIIPQNEIKEINSNITRDFQINIWDFGGQEIYHSTHQFFLTKRSIYLLVTESRKEDSHDDFFYWLNIIKLLGDKSPVMMILNKADQPTKDLPINEYKAAFNNILSFNKISLKKEFKTEFIEFKNKLKKIASELPHIGNPLPKVWVDIRRDIEKLKINGKNFISLDEYFEICRNHYRKEDSALFLSEYFHDLGVIIHFQNDIDLKDLVILNHEWITKGVYKILDDKKVIQQKGRFNYEDIRRLWASDDHHLKTRELISLMKNTKFDLCFEIKNGEFLVPRLLPVDEVEHDWEPTPQNSKFEIRYKFMPKGIVARLIVKMNSDIYQDKYWRYGVILNFENTFAIIKRNILKIRLR
jgi:internalin A